MGKKRPIKVEEISKVSSQLSHVDSNELVPLPPPYDGAEGTPEWKPLTDTAKEQYEATLDDTIAVSIPRPKNKEEEEALVRKFLSGLEKLFSKENNWTFLQPLVLSMENCAKCQTCSEACHIYEMSGYNEIYRPLYRSEVLRRIYFKYFKRGGKFFGRWQHGDIDLNWSTVARLIELAYRCNL